VYLIDSIIREVEAKYGSPVEIERAYDLNRDQIAIVRRGQRHGRCHDVTLVIPQGGRIIVIRKPSYPAGAYRAPSGGVEPGESFEAGAAREAREETGLDIALDRYLIRAHVDFRCGDEVVHWITHVMQAHALGGVVQPQDTREIVEARWATTQEICGPIREALLATGSPGLCYRAELDCLAVRLLQESGAL
jgi:8-oxo-dGTP pyrophosphatase MutT (NUDIX family)